MFFNNVSEAILPDNPAPASNWLAALYNKHNPKCKYGKRYNRHSALGYGCEGCHREFLDRITPTLQLAAKRRASFLCLPSTPTVC